MISIIIPVYKVEKYIHACIDSILSQTYTDMEIILVDDGSPDQCPTICDEYAQKDRRIKVLHKRNGGLSSARNAGLDVAKGHLIMFADSDDFLDKNMVKTLYELYCSTGADIVGCEVKRYNNGSAYTISEFHRCESTTIFSSEEILKEMISRRIDCASWNKLYKREIIGDYRFIEGRYNEDFIFLFHLYQQCKKVAYTNEALYFYRKTPNSITNIFDDKSLDPLKNALEIEKEIYRKKLNLKNEIKQYKIRICLQIAWSIKKNKLQKKYSEINAMCKKEIRNRIIFIIKEKGLPLKLKILGLYSALF